MKDGITMQNMGNKMPEMTNDKLQKMMDKAMHEICSNSKIMKAQRGK